MHNLVLGRHDHLVLLLEYLLLQLLLTAHIVALGVLPQIGLINYDFHLAILVNLWIVHLFITLRLHFLSSLGHISGICCILFLLGS